MNSSNHSKQLWKNAVNCALKYTLYLSIYRDYYWSFFKSLFLSKFLMIVYTVCLFQKLNCLWYRNSKTKHVSLRKWRHRERMGQKGKQLSLSKGLVTWKRKAQSKQNDKTRCTQKNWLFKNFVHSKKEIRKFVLKGIKNQIVWIL